VADEAFERLWRAPGGRELVALHALFAEGVLPAEAVRGALALTRDEFDAAVAAARAAGLVEEGAERVALVPHPHGSASRARLDACLEEHREEWASLVPRINSLLILKFLRTPPRTP